VRSNLSCVCFADLEIEIELVATAGGMRRESSKVVCSWMCLQREKSFWLGSDNKEFDKSDCHLLADIYLV
jgi:hypothetical protein